MELDRGALAKIDRRILSGLDDSEHSQMVRVPVSEAVWSMWRRCCKALGVATERGVVGLIAHELGIVEGSTTGGGVVFAGELQRRLVARAESLDVRERRLDERERSLRVSERRGGLGPPYSDLHRLLEPKPDCVQHRLFDGTDAPHRAQ